MARTRGPLRRALAALRTPTGPVVTAQSGTDDDVAQMLGALGPAMLEANESTSDVDDTLNQVAAAYGRERLLAIALPTLVMVQAVRHGRAAASVFPVKGSPLRLDQAGEVQRLADDIIADPKPPDEVIAKVERIRAAPARFNAFWAIVGHALLTLGFGLVLNPTLAALPAYLGLGTLVGIIVVFGSRLATLALVLPVLTSFVVTIICIRLLAQATGGDALLLIAPPLLSFLPGMALTIAAVELTSGQIIAGASRFVYGVAQLALLSFGVVAGIIVAGQLPSSGDQTPLGWWAPWLGILLVAGGFLLYSSAPKGTLGWIVLVLAVAYAAQAAAATFVEPWLSGFFGAVVIVPFARVIRLVRSAPPTVVTTTCGFWILVPGAMGFMRVTQAIAGTGADTAESLYQVVGAVLAIAIGMLVGSGISRDLVAVRRAIARRGSTQTAPVPTQNTDATPPRPHPAGGDETAPHTPGSASAP